MSVPEPTPRRKASKDALKTIYFVIVGIAITESLERVFVENDRFVGHDLVERSHVTPVLLLMAFLPTVVRFAHGASIHMDVMHVKAYKPALDFAGFLVQGSLFYVMSATLDRPKTFLLLFTLLLVFDTAWLVLLRCLRYVSFSATEWQWMITNAALIGAFAIAYVLAELVGQWVSVIVAASAIAAAIADYVMNREFYFPRRDEDRAPYVTTEAT